MRFLRSAVFYVKNQGERMCGHDSRRNTSICVHVVLCLQGIFQLEGCYVHFDILRSSVCEKGEKDVAGRSTCMFRGRNVSAGGLLRLGIGY